MEMKNTMKQIKQIKPLVKIVKIGNDFMNERDEDQSEVKWCLLTQISDYVNSLYGKELSDVDTVSEFVNLESTVIITEEEIEEMILNYINSDSFKELE